MVHQLDCRAFDRNSNAINVLLVEDNVIMQDHFACSIQRHPRLKLIGIVKEGERALTVLGSECVNVLMVDIGLPDMSGIDLIRRADCQPERTPSHQKE